MPAIMIKRSVPGNIDCPHCFCIIPEANFTKSGTWPGSYTCPRCLTQVIAIRYEKNEDGKVISLEYDLSHPHTWSDGEWHFRKDVDELCKVVIRGRGDDTEWLDTRRM